MNIIVGYFVYKLFPQDNKKLKFDSHIRFHHSQTRI